MAPKLVKQDTAQPKVAASKRLSRHARHRITLEDHLQEEDNLRAQVDHTSEAFTSLKKRMREGDLLVSRKMAATELHHMQTEVSTLQQSVTRCSNVVAAWSAHIEGEIAFLKALRQSHSAPTACGALSSRIAALEERLQRPPFATTQSTATSSTGRI